MSGEAEREFGDWLRALPADAPVTVARIHVVDARPLSRAIAAELGVVHESPQAIWLRPDLSVAWHGSHGDVTRESLEREQPR